MVKLEKLICLIVALIMIVGLIPMQDVLAEEVFPYSLSISNNNLNYNGNMLEGSVNVNVYNQNTYSSSAVIVCSIMDNNNKTIAIKTKNVTIPNSVNIFETFSFSLTVQNSIGKKVKAMLWNDANQMVPLAMPVNYEIADDQIKLAGVIVGNENNGSSSEGLVKMLINDNYGTKYANTDDRFENNTYTFFKVGTTNAKDFIGRKVIVIVNYEPNKAIEPTIISINENPAYNDKLTINFSDLISASEFTDDLINLNYYKDKSNEIQSSISIPKYVLPTFVNGVESNYTGMDFKNDIEDGKYEYTSGQIEFYNYDRNGTADFDAMFFSVYENFVVDSVDPVQKEIYATNTSPFLMTSLSYDSDDRDIELTIKDKDGNRVVPTDLKKWDVLSIKSNYAFGCVSDVDKEIYDCTLVRNSVTGKVDEISNDFISKYFINGKYYEIDPIAECYIYLEIGSEGTFYIDQFGKIVAFVRVDNNYALFINCQSLESGGYKVKFYTTEGNMVEKDLNSVVKWVDKLTTYDELAKNMVAETSIGDTLVSNKSDYTGRIFTYNLNKSGCISSLIFSPDVLTAPIGDSISRSNEAYIRNVIQTNVNQASDCRLKFSIPKKIITDRTYIIDEKTKFIVANKGSYSWGDIPASNLSTLNYDSIICDTLLNNAKLSAFDVDQFNHVKMVLIEGTIEFNPIIDPPPTQNNIVGTSLVKSYSTAYNSNYEEITKFRIISNNDYPIDATNIKEFTLANISTVNGGDADTGSIVLEESRNELDEVNKLSVLTTHDNNGKFMPSSELINKANNLDKDIEYYFGKVTDKAGSYILFENELDNNLDSCFDIPNSTMVMIYDERRTGSNRVYEGSIGSIAFTNSEPPQISAYNVSEYKIFVRLYQGAIKDVVLYIYCS